MLQYAGKVALVTGGAQGMGRMVAELLAGAGARVIIADIQQGKAEETAAAIRATGADCSAVAVDLADVESIKQMVAAAAARHRRIDVLIHCAAIYTTRPVEEITPADWDRTMAINLRGTFFLCQQVIGVMKGHGGGSIVNFSSLSGKIGGVFAGVDYSASKAGVDCITRALAKYGAQFGIRVNSVCPGAVNTTLLDPYTPEQKGALANAAVLKRLAEPIEVARAAVFLASDAASYITGETLDVNGGMHMD